MNVFEQEAALDKSADEGVWVAYSDTFRLKLGGASGPQYRKVQEASAKLIRAAYKGRKVPDDAAEKNTLHCIANGLIYGWDGGLDENGKPLPFLGADGAPLAFSPQAALDVITQLKRVRDFVMLFSVDDSNFETVAEAQTKNS